MELWEIILSVTGTVGGIASAVLVVLLTKRGDISAMKLKRKFELEDKLMAQNAEYARIEKKLDDFIDTQNKQNASLRQRMEGLESAMHTNTKGMKAILYSSLRSEALSYIKQGVVDIEARIKLKDNYADYVLTYHDDSLKNIMAELDNLRATAKGG